MLIVIGIGSVCTLAFHALLKEKRDDDEHESHLVTNEALLGRDTMIWYDWMKEPQFWLVNRVQLAELSCYFNQVLSACTLRFKSIYFMRIM
jgi:hypothetical protein